MTVPLLRQPAVWGVFLLLLAALSACQSGAASTPTQASSAHPGPTPTMKVYAAPTSTPRSVQAMTEAIANNPTFLASQHRAAGLQCQSCHIPFPPDGAPSSDTCLSCHTGGYAKLAALTPGRMNPHQSHLGELPCAFCHAGHEPSVSQCTQCKHKPVADEVLPGREQ